MTQKFITPGLKSEFVSERAKSIALMEYYREGYQLLTSPNFPVPPGLSLPRTNVPAGVSIPPPGTDWFSDVIYQVFFVLSAVSGESRKRLSKKLEKFKRERVRCTITYKYGNYEISLNPTTLLAELSKPNTTIKWPMVTELTEADKAAEAKEAAAAATAAAGPTADISPGGPGRGDAREALGNLLHIKLRF